MRVVRNSKIGEFSLQGLDIARNGSHSIKCERCRDCICLIEKNGMWFCDEYQDYCKNIEVCGEWRKQN